MYALLLFIIFGTFYFVATNYQLNSFATSVQLSYNFPHKFEIWNLNGICEAIWQMVAIVNKS